MFELSLSEILILSVVALIFIGPKDLPVLLRTIGRYVGLAKRQVGELRSQLDLVLEEAEPGGMRSATKAVPAPDEASAQALARVKDVDLLSDRASAAFEGAIRSASQAQEAKQMLR